MWFTGRGSLAVLILSVWMLPVSATSASNPFQLTGVANMMANGQVIMKDSLVYATGYHGIQVYNISDPSNIRPVSRLYLQNGGPTQYMEKSGDIIWATGYRKADRSIQEGSLFKIDAANPAELRLLHEYDIPYHAEGIALHGPDTVVVSWGRIATEIG